MSLLMPDINLRRAKRHLERYWRQVLGGDQPQERRRLTFRFKSDKMSRTKAAQRSTEGSSIKNLEQKTEPTGVASESDEVETTAAPLDCGSSLVAASANDNQDTESNYDGELEKSTEENPAVDADQEDSANPVQNSKSGQPQPSASVLKGRDPKSEVQQTPSTTSTKGSSSSLSSLSTVSSAESTASCIGKPPRSICRGSRGNRGSYPPPQMPKPKLIPRVEGPTLGAIMQRVHLNDGDVRELDFSSLALRKKRLESDGCALVARALTTNHTVRKLIIRDHAIGDEGAIALSKMLCNNTTLQALDLYGNGIGDRGAEALAQALYGHDSLTYLSLRSNRITDGGVEALAQAVRCNCTLKSLELEHNKITRTGAQALLDALDVNSCLETMNLDGNGVPTSIASQLAASLARNRAESLILESQAAQEMAENIAYYVDRPEEDSSDDDDDDEDEYWEEDDDDSESSGFLSCSGVTDIPLSSSGLWI